MEEKPTYRKAGIAIAGMTFLVATPPEDTNKMICLTIIVCIGSVVQYLLDRKKPPKV